MGDSVSEIDWDRCFNELLEQLPQVRADLKRRIYPLIRGPVSCDVSIGDYPPHISVRLDHHVRWENELRRAMPRIGRVIDDVAKEYDLKATRGGYGPLPDKGERREWQKAEFEYTFKPYYERYEVMEEPRPGA